MCDSIWQETLRSSVKGSLLKAIHHLYIRFKTHAEKGLYEHGLDGNKGQNSSKISKSNEEQCYTSFP